MCVVEIADLGMRSGNIYISTFKDLIIYISLLRNYSYINYFLDLVDIYIFPDRIPKSAISTTHIH